jgi:hypothetical protein
MADYSQRFTISGLETLTIVMPLAGTFTLAGKIRLPRLAATDPTDPNFLSYPSAVVTTIKQNGTTIFTSTAGADGFSIPIEAALNDSFTVALTSSSAQDEVLDAVSAQVRIG